MFDKSLLTNYNYFRRSNAPYNQEISGTFIQSLGFYVAYSEVSSDTPKVMQNPARIQIVGIPRSGLGARLNVAHFHIPLQRQENYERYKQKESYRIASAIGLIRSHLNGDALAQDQIVAAVRNVSVIQAQVRPLPVAVTTIDRVLFELSEHTTFVALDALNF